MGEAKRAEEAKDLNLVPIMNLVTILIPFLLMASSFVALAVIDTSAPAICCETEGLADDHEPLNLTVAITRQGWTVWGTGIEPNLQIPCGEAGCGGVDAYDRAELTRILSRIKDDWPDERNVILLPDPEIPYDVLVWTMDAVREDPNRQENGENRQLFPYSVIAGGR